MNIKNERINDQVQELTIEIGKADYSEKVETALKKYRRTAQVPGFRPGNAPMGLIRKMYEKHCVAEEVNNMMGESLYGYLRDNKLNIMLEPLPVEEKSHVDFESGEDFVFVYEYALQPEFELNLSKLPKVKSFKIVASPEEKEEFIMQLRKRHGEYISPEEIGEDDYITVKYGEDKSGFFFTKDLNEKGAKLFIGKKKDEQFKVNFRDIFISDQLLSKFLKVKESDLEADNKYTYTVTIDLIGRVIPAELNEDFFKKAYPDGTVKTKAELEKLAAHQIEDQWKGESDRQFMNDAIGTLLENIKIDFPDDFVKRYILYVQKDLTAETLDAKYDEYIKSFKWQLIENKLEKDYNINVTQDEVKDFVRQFFIANYFGNFNPEEVKDRLDSLVADALKNKDDVKKIYDQLFDKKIQDVLYANMQKEEKSGTFHDFIAEVTGQSQEKKAKKAAPKAKKPAAAKEVKEEKPAEKKPAAKKPAAKKPAAKKTTKE